MAGGFAADPARALHGWIVAIGAVSDDPASEVLALVWGPRFDRVHALSLLARLPWADGAWMDALHAFGERFDALPPPAQRTLRRQLLRIADNAACSASC
jgi:hypothetical protein